MKIHFNKKIYFTFLGIQTILAINGWEQALKDGAPIFDTLIRIILVPLIMTLVFSPLFAKKEKKIGKDGHTKLMQLCTDKDINEIQIELSKNDAVINLQDKGGYSALMYAVASGNIEIVELLLKSGADKNLKTEKGNTALYFAEKNKFSNIENLLKSTQQQPSSLLG